VGRSFFAFGNITTTDDNNPSNNALVAQVVARVANVPANANGAVLTNTARLTYTHAVSGSTGISGGAQAVSLVEPFLAISKAAQTARTPVGADDLVTYTIRITNTGSSTAYDLNITDTLPSGLTFWRPAASPATNSIITTDTNTIGATALNYGVRH
jgi:uncharacterized repeat protein (TIGR01451 family)